MSVRSRALMSALSPALLSLALSFGVAAPALAAESADWLMDDPPPMGEDPLFAERHHGGRLHERICDLRAGVAIVPGLRINENIHKGAVTTGYDWKGEAPVAAEYAVAGLVDAARWLRAGALTVGLEASFAEYRITPDSYDVGGASFANTSSERLHADYLAARLLCGWASPFWYTPAGAIHLELLPHAGGGPVWLETQGFDPVGNPSLTRGHGWLLDYGARLGAYISDDWWVVGIDAGWRETHGKPRLDNADGSQSEILVDQRGVTWQAQIGVRF
jgi:hypothetical protein